jgi:ribose transport system substrate-binding protein
VDLAASKNRVSRHKKLGVLTGLICVSVLAVACGSSSSGGSPPASAPASSAPAGQSAVAAAVSLITQGYAGLYRTPASGPAAQKGKTIYVVDCGNLALGCYVPAEAVQAAGKSLGWTVKIVDGQLTPAGYTSGIQQAIAAKPDGIVTVGIDCPNAKSAYEQAKAAKIPIIGVFEFDCNDPKVGGPKLMTAQIDTGTGQDPGEWFYNWGVLHAAYIIDKTDGKAKVIEFSQIPFLDTTYEDQGFQAEMAKCTTCKIIDKQDITAADLGGAGGATKVSSAILAHPDANAIYFDNDTLLGESASVLKSNPHPSWIVVGSEGLPTTIPLIGKTVSGIIALPSTWLGWCAAYSMNEVLAAHPVTDCGADFEVIDQGHNLPAAGQTSWTPKINFESVMKSQWGG